MEEHFDMEMSIRARLKFNQLDRVWLLYRGEYTPYIRERTCRIIEDGYVDDPSVCSYCGAHYDDGRYCKYCGAKVVNE